MSTGSCLSHSHEDIMFGSQAINEQARSCSDPATIGVPQHDKNKAPKRPKQVRFQPTIKGVYVAYPEHEVAARWRTKDDERSTGADLRETVTVMRVHRGTVPAHLEEAITCRGLEHITSKRTFRENAKAKNNAIQAVLDECDRQAMLANHHRDSSEYGRRNSEETIASISSCLTARARSAAQLRGQEDAAYVQSIRR